MRKRLAIELKNLREAFSEEYIVDDYPAELLLPFRYSAECDENGWHALTFERNRLDYKMLQSRGAIDVVFHHLTSGVMVASPSLASGLLWRIVYPGDAILCSHCLTHIYDLLAIRYEIAPPQIDWLREILKTETPWILTANPEQQSEEATS